MKKLTCHCGAIEAEVRIPIGGVEKIMRCNCSICKKKGYIIGVLGPDDFKLTKGEDKLSLYQFYTCLLYTSPSPRDDGVSRMPSSA